MSYYHFAAISEAPTFQLSASDLLALADALALKISTEITDGLSLADAIALKAGIPVSDAASLADAVSMVLEHHLPLAEALAVVEAVAFSLKTGFSDTMAMSETLETLFVDANPLQQRHRPRYRMSLTIGSATKYYSTDARP